MSRENKLPTERAAVRRSKKAGEPRGWPNVCVELPRRSGRFGELDRNTDGGDALQRSAVDVGRLDAVDFKIETNDRVGVAFLRFADQRLDGRLTLCFGGGGADGAPTGGRLDAADRIMIAA